MPKKWITASDLYNFKKCRYRPFMDYNGDPSEKIEIHPLVRLLWEAGVQYETKVVESFKAEHSAKTCVEIAPGEPASVELAEQTLKAMKGGADFIYQGVLMHDDRLGSIPGQGVQPIHAGDHLHQRALHVCVQAKLEVNPGITGIGKGAHFFQSRQTPQHRFNGLDDLRFNFSG